MLYRLYPTLLNSFSLYQSQARDSFGKIIVDDIEMIERINRVLSVRVTGQRFECGGDCGEGFSDHAART